METCIDIFVTFKYWQFYEECNIISFLQHPVLISFAVLSNCQTAKCTLWWSEKSESCNCQTFQAVSEPHYHSEFRTVGEIEIRPFFICEIGLTFLQLKTIERFQWVRFQFRWLFWTHCGNVVQKVPEMFDKCNFHFFHSTLVHIDITTFLDWGSFTFWRCQGAWGHWQSVTRWGYLSWWDEPQSEWPQTPQLLRLTSHSPVGTDLPRT